MGAVEVEFGEVDLGCGTDAVEAAAHDTERVLCGNSSTRPVCATGKRRRHGAPDATATAMSSARNDLQVFGSMGPSTLVDG